MPFTVDLYIPCGDAWQLLEYCVLLDGNGSKRFAVRPDVVFPKRPG